MDEKTWRWIYEIPHLDLCQRPWNMEKRRSQQDLWHQGQWAALQVGMGSGVGLGDAQSALDGHLPFDFSAFISEFASTPFPE